MTIRHPDPPSLICRICHRELKDPEAQRRGMGADCAAKVRQIKRMERKQEAQGLGLEMEEQP